ncbi:hypothetical protein AAVH_24663 [Aphelenchoides avenae]|nr:hypothetical protein AAVH_33397 [Aphelenchus avenae]KAH7708088.1 hypothetical protein AAVH_24663 [Aphelenchus avenae]
MAGNTGLRIGFTAVSIGELVLIVAQLLLWICTKTKELPEVPSCRRSNYAFAGRDDSEEDDDDDDKPPMRDTHKLSDAGCIVHRGAFGADALSCGATDPGAEMVPRHRLPPKTFENSQNRIGPLKAGQLSERVASPSGVRADVPQKGSLYERLELTKTAEHSASLVPPALASALGTESPAFE